MAGKFNKLSIKNSPIIFILLCVFLFPGCCCNLKNFRNPIPPKDNTSQEDKSTPTPEIPGKKELDLCSKNVEVTGSTLESYCLNKGAYPRSLDELKKEGYIKEIPLCPLCKKPYTYQKSGSSYMLRCGGKDAHLETGLVDKGFYPVYTSQEGLSLKGEISIAKEIFEEPEKEPTERPEEYEQSVKESTKTHEVYEEPEKEPTKKPQNEDFLIRETLKKHYEAINDNRYKEAYNLRSKHWHRKQSFEEFVDNWSNNKVISLLFTDIVAKKTSRASVKIRLYSEDTNLSDGSTIKKDYVGTVTLVKEKGKWKIDNVEIN